MGPNGRSVGEVVLAAALGSRELGGRVPGDKLLTVAELEVQFPKHRQGLSARAQNA